MILDVDTSRPVGNPDRDLPPTVLPAVAVLFLALLVLVISPSRVEADATDRIAAFRSGEAKTSATAQLRRGMNFGDAIDAPNEGEWGWRLFAEAFRTVREAGFDHVRVPMRISAHARREAPFSIDPMFLRRIDWVIDQALSNDLGVVIDMHHYDEIMDAPGEHGERLASLWRQIADRYQGLPRAVVYEILNEPTRKLTADLWNPILARAIAEIRSVDATRLLIIEGANWASASDLRDTLRFPSGDANLIGSFHMYAPVYFTHQGAHWMAERFQTTGIVFPGPPPRPIVPLPAAEAASESREFFRRYNTEPVKTNPGGPAVIVEQMEMARAFAERTGLRVYLGEFGSIIKADPKSRARWTRIVRMEAEKRGFGWAYWDFCRNLAAYSPCGPTGQWLPEIKDALLD